MTCPTSISSTPVTPFKRFLNWARRLSFTAARAYRPGTRGEIVALIQEAEQAGQRIKWTGSLWSFMGVFVSHDIVIESDSISGAIARKLFIDHLELADPGMRARLVQIRGGTKVFNVNRLLHGLGEGRPGGVDEADLGCGKLLRALHTLGGSGGQSIAGLMATGSHGGDVHLPPIADCVRAIHLIGPGGQEFWIEPSSGFTSGAAAHTQALLRQRVAAEPDAAAHMCGTILVRKDDALFRAAMVSVGRMGFVYSLVIETVAAFKLRETVTSTTWESLRPRLTSASFGAFSADTHFLNVLINPFRTDGAHGAKLTVREVVGCATENTGGGGAAGLLSRLCKTEDLRAAILPLLAAALATMLASIAGLAAAVAGLLAAAGAAASIPIVGWIAAGALFAAAAVLGVAIAALSAASIAVTGLIGWIATAGGLTGTQLVAALANIAYPLGLKNVVAQLLSGALDSAYPNGRKVNIGWKIMDTYDYAARDFCQMVDAMDIAFDVDAAVDESSGYLGFIGDVFAIFDDLFGRDIPVAGLLSLRYTRNTAALIGMSQFARTCHIEIPLLQDFAGNPEFMRRVQAAARARDGIPHWGQLMDGYDRADIRRLHGARLTSWRRSLTALIRDGGGRPSTFSNAFTVAYGLEPLDTRPVSAVRFSITVGDDALNDHDPFRHGDSQAWARVTLVDGSVHETPLNAGAEWPRHTTHHREVMLPPGTTWGDIASVSIHHFAAGNSYNADNWTMNEIVIFSHLYDVEVREQYRERGNPVWQFRLNDHQVWRHDFI